MTVLSSLKKEQNHVVPVDLEFLLIIASWVAEILKPNNLLPELQLAVTTKSTFTLARHAATINSKPPSNTFLSSLKLVDLKLPTGLTAASATPALLCSLCLFSFTPSFPVPEGSLPSPLLLYFFFFFFSYLCYGLFVLLIPHADDIGVNQTGICYWFGSFTIPHP